MFEDALKFPWQGDRNVETLVIGGVLTLLGVLFVPILFVYGYVVRTIRRSAAGDVAAPPAFDEWSELLVDGLVAGLISLVYFAVPAILITLGAVLFFVPVTIVGSGADAGGSVIAAGGLVLAFVVAVLSVMVVLVAAYLVPAAVAAYALTGRFGAAFSLSVLRPIVTDRQYAVGWLVAVAIGVIFQTIGSVVSTTGIGLLLVPFLSFYGTVAGAYAIGVGVADLDIATGPVEDAPTGRVAV